MVQRSLSRIAGLFTIRTRFDACLIIYALALGAVERGKAYREAYPGVGGWLLFGACLLTIFIAGAKILDAVAAEKRRRAGEFTTR